MSRSRKINSKLQKPKVYIYCEGEVTEVRYLTELERSQNNVKFEFVQKGAVPTTLYESAKTQFKRIEKAKVPDRVWLIFDRDDHPKVDQVISECLDTDIVLGYSNPCFEVWLSWHIQDYGGTHNRRELKKLLSRVCDDYCEKRKSLLRAGELIKFTNDACERAFKSDLKLKKSGAEFGRPTSKMYEIISDFSEFSNMTHKFWTKPKK